MCLVVCLLVFSCMFAIFQCPIDTRRSLAENILLTGGTAMLPGFKHRLMSELHELRKLPKYKDKLAIETFKFHSPPAKENYVAWLGGEKQLQNELFLFHGHVEQELWCSSSSCIHANS